MRVSAFRILTVHMLSRVLLKDRCRLRSSDKFSGDANAAGPMDRTRRSTGVDHWVEREGVLPLLQNKLLAAPGESLHLSSESQD